MRGQDQGRGGCLAGGEDRGLVGGDLGALADPAAAAVQVDGVHAVHLAGDDRPGVAGGVLRDADQDQGQEAQGDVGADAVLFAVVDRSDLEDLLEVAEATLDIEETLEQAGGVRGEDA